MDMARSVGGPPADQNTVTQTVAEYRKPDPQPHPRPARRRAELGKHMEPLKGQVRIGHHRLLSSSGRSGATRTYGS